MQSMLVLSRRIGETILIGNAIQLTVVAVHNNQVRLGITAPLDVPVHRTELKAISGRPDTAAFGGNVDDAKTV